MTWADRQWTFDLAYGLDRFAASVFFLESRMSISAICWLVKKGKADQLKLRPWQMKFLAWLEPRLSASHCEWAAKDDLVRAQAAVTLLTPGTTP